MTHASLLFSYIFLLSNLPLVSPLVSSFCFVTFFLFRGIFRLTAPSLSVGVIHRSVSKRLCVGNVTPNEFPQGVLFSPSDITTRWCLSITKVFFFSGSPVADSVVPYDNKSRPSALTRSASPVMTYVRTCEYITSRMAEWVNACTKEKKSNNWELLVI